MFNFRSYKFAENEKKDISLVDSYKNTFTDYDIPEDYFYKSLRNTDEHDPSKFLHKYEDYLDTVHSLDKMDHEQSMTFASDLALNPGIILLLENLVNESKGFPQINLLDSRFIDYILKRFDSALFSYITKNIDYSSDRNKVIKDSYEQFSNDPEKLIWWIEEISKHFDNLVLFNGKTAQEVKTFFLHIISVLKELDKINNDRDYNINLIAHYLSSGASSSVFFNAGDSDKSWRINDYRLYIKRNENNPFFQFENLLRLNLIENKSLIDDVVEALETSKKFVNLMMSYKFSFLKYGLNDKGFNLTQKIISGSYSNIKNHFPYDPDLGRYFSRYTRKSRGENFTSEEQITSSKHFQEYSLPNSSNAERVIFDNLEKLGLIAIPAKQAGNINLVDDEGQKFAFRIDFLLPCNVREYDGENYTLRSDIVFVGEYFGYYGNDYETRKKRKILWQNNLENALNQRCLHIDPDSDLCAVLREKNIDSKCYPDFGSELFSTNSDNQKKTYYVKSQIQHFLYQYLVNELLWEINYDYSLNTMDNFNRVRENNGVYLDRFEKLLLDVERYSPSYLVKECAKIVDDYKKVFDKKRTIRKKSLRLSFVYNHSKSPSN
jgi:hypothetical protein